MLRVPLATGDTKMNVENFWNSVFLYHDSPHLINRRILGVSQLDCLEMKSHHFEIRDLYSRLKSIRPESSVDNSFIVNILAAFGNDCIAQDMNWVKEAKSGVFVSVRLLLPRNMKLEKCVEVVVLDKNTNRATFMAISNDKPNNICPSIPYDIELDHEKLMRIYVHNEETNVPWLVEKLLPKLQLWSVQKKSCNQTQPVTKSLSLIPVDKYCILYHELKLKYGRKIVENWRENTDPLKFVYEDIAIATYLMLLWAETSQLKQSFVDLGCGNGLLVYILTEEGHSGYGIDLRPRQIWTMYPETTKLIVESISPSSKTVYPDVDWIIGNHSDELTPWIPVIAARSSIKCKYFLLPCCAYEFSGKKFQRLNASQSQYQDYLNYIKQISEHCGFHTEIDRLRIPSTKRICLIGTEKKTNEDIRHFINSKYNTEFEARPVQELVRNCTKLDRSIVDCIVEKITTHLLSERSFVQLKHKQWNCGRKVAILELVELIAKEDLKELKNNCGGLQTLLKNHHFIFLVKNGMVQLRMPVLNKTNQNQHKVRACWFYKNHPDGCTLEDIDCSYLHEN